MRRLILACAITACVPLAAASSAAASTPTVGFVQPAAVAAASVQSAGPAVVRSGPLPIEVQASSDVNSINRCNLDWRPAGTGDWQKVETPARADYTAPYTWTATIPDGLADDTTVQFKASCYDNTAGTRLSSSAFRTFVVKNPPVAAVSVTADRGTLTHLDAGSSAGYDVTYAWELDGRAVGSTETLDLQPQVGTHTVKLTVTDALGRTDTVERQLTTTWRGYPWIAQVDRANGHEGSGLYLPKLIDFISPDGPWRAISCVNNGYSFQPQADGSLRTEVHQGDHPGEFGNGGDRCSISVDEGLSPNPDVNGNGDGQARFYKFSFKIDAPTTNLADVFNNVTEWHGRASGPSVLKVATDGAGQKLFVSFSSLVNGEWSPQKKIDTHPLVLGKWENYIVEARWSLDPDVGYVRVYRDGVCVSCGHPSADAEGRLFGQSYKAFADGSSENMNWGLQNYRGTADRGIGSTTVPTSVPAGSSTIPLSSMSLVPGASSARVNGQVVRWTGHTADSLTGVTGLTTAIAAGTPFYLRESLPDTQVSYRDVLVGPTLASVTG